MADPAPGPPAAGLASAECGRAPRAGLASAAADAAERYRGLSWWWDSLPGPLTVRPGLPGDLDVDVAIVGAGFSGLWTARSLAAADPALRVAVLEAEVAGFGASGRNGGWCSAIFSASDARIARQHGIDAARRMRRAMEGAVDEVGRAAAEDGIDWHFSKGGTVVAARDAAQEARARAEVAAVEALGVGELHWLGRAAAQEAIGASDVRGATYTPHCAAIHPGLLVRGLADAAERRGVQLYERTPARAIVPGGNGRRPSVTTPSGTVRADVVVRAVEAWTASLPGEHRTLAPVYSMMIATEPLEESFWKGAGLAHRQTFSDHRHLVIYGQRTADGRIAFGGRGAPYHFASAVAASFDRDPRVHRALRATLVALFPALADAAVSHRWGGPLGVPRDWHSSVGYDRASGLAWAGGYVGDGVSTANLAGRTLADLLTGARSDLVSLPWVGHRSPAWEPEPLRWLGVNAGLVGVQLADRSERRRGRPSRLGEHMARLFGA